MIRITAILSSAKWKQYALGLLILASTTYANAQISGLSSASVNQTTTYTYNNGFALIMPTWQITKGQVMSTSQNGTAYSAVVKWTSMGTGTVKFYIANGGVLKSTKNVTINTALPSSPATPSSSTSCGTSTLTRGTPPSGVTWYWQGTNSNGTSTSNSGLHYSISANGTYYLRARNSTGQWSSSSASVSGSVVQNPSMPSTPSINKNCGSSILTKSPATPGTTTYWQTSSSGTSTTNSSNTKTVTSPGTYYLRARKNTTPYCWSGARSFAVTINSKPATPSSTTVSNHAGYSTITRGNPTSGITWFWQTSSSGSSTSNSSATYTASLIGTYNIYLRARNNSSGCWSQSLRSTSVTVSLPPNKPSTPTSSKSCGSTALNRSSPPSGVTWYWQGTNSIGTSISQSGPSYTITTNGTYHLRARNNSTGLWSTSSSYVLGLVVNNPASPTTPSITYNCGSNVLTKASNPSGQTWYWQTSSGGTSTGNSSTTYTVNNTGTYYLRSRTNNSPNCWSTARTINVDVVEKPVAPTVALTSVNECGYTTLTRPDPPAGHTYYWQSSGAGTSIGDSSKDYDVTAAGIFFLRAQDDLTGCWSVQSVSLGVTVDPVPAVPTTPAIDTEGCRTTTIQRGTPPLNATWYWQNTSSGTSTNTADADPNKTVTTDGTYYLRARDNSTLCWSTASAITVDVNEGPAGPLEPTVSAERFGTGELTMTVGANLPTVNPYRWYTDATGGTMVNEGREYTAALTSINTTTFYIAAVDINDCESIYRAPVSAATYSTPTITIGNNPIQEVNRVIDFGNGVTLNASTGYDSYAWIKNNETVGTAAQLNVTVPGDYVLMVTKGDISYTTESYSMLYNIGVSKVNYVKTSAVLTEGITSDADVYNLPATDQVQSLTYLDGLNRPIQSIAIDGAGIDQNIVQNYVYDQFGRTEKSYLPNTSPMYALGYYNPTTAVTDQQDYYDASNFASTDKPYPYAMTKYDDTPLHRPIEVGAPGADWQLGGGHTVRTDFGFNTGGTVRKWSANGASTATYAAHELVVNTLTDENDHIVRTYTDGRGLTILKEVQETGSTYLNTYSVHDDMGRLVYTIPPKAVEAMQSANNWNVSLAAVTKLVFSYQYDTRGRLVEKKVPGALPEYIVYDQFDRVVLTQDGNLRGNDQWGFIKYDYKERAVYTGIYTNTADTTRPTVQALLDTLDYDNGAAYYEVEQVNATYHGYSNAVFPTSNTEVLAASYYDHYNFDRVGGADYSYDNAHLAGQAASNFTRIKGWATGSKTRILGSNNWLTNVVFYDKKGRTIQSISNNHKNLELSDVTSVVYDFSGKILKSKTITYDGTDAATTVNNEYAYDAQGRIVDIWHQADRGYAITWKDIVGVSIVDNTITKTAGNSWTNAGATSINELAAGEDGWLGMTALENNTYRMFGLAVQNSSPHYNTIDFALYPRATGLLQVYEKGVHKGEFGTYAPGDKLMVQRQGSTIYYLRNGVVFYTSSVSSSGALVADMSLYTLGSTVADIDASFGVRNDVIWGDANGVDVAHNTLIKTAGDGWGNAGAASLNIIKDGDNGGIQVMAEGDFRVIVGLSEVNTNDNYNTIDYCILMANNYVLLAYENGSNNGNLGTYAVGDIIEVKRISGQIHYKKNGVTLQISNASSTGTLIGDVSLYYTGDRVSNAKMTTTPKMLVAHYEYSDLGQLVKKNIHKTADNEYLQTVDFAYNIRGWLKSINDPANITADQLFGMELLYNENITELGQQASYNGNISAMKWKEQYGNGVANDTKAYSYAYDHMDRLTSTQYGEGAGFTMKGNQYALESVGYDANGNMETLERKGLNPATGLKETIDDLTYTFDGNRMSNVDDTGLAIGYDQQSTGSAIEYTYDANGNMDSDDNKDITSITYNELNKPKVVTFGDGTVITYVYSAAGSKLSQQVNVGGTITTTDYLGDKLYVNDQLQSMAQPEGRIVYNDGDFEYQYAYTDHLGNVRMLYTSQDNSVTFTATMESDVASQLDDSLFENMNPTPDVDAVSFDEVTRLNSAAPVGPGIGLPVYPGDQVSLNVKAYHRGGSDFNNAIDLTTLINEVAGAFGGSSTGGSEALQVYNNFNSAINTMGLHGTADPNRPAAYLNYILFDKNHVMKQYGYEQISTSGSLETLAINNVIVQEEGFVYVYLSNESNSLNEVYFDDLSITVTESKVIQNTNYYPFGLQHANSWTRPTDLKNNFLYNAGAELNEQTKNYETFYRDYDPALGRFNQIDPLASSFSSWNPYQYAFNDPVALNDPMGDAPDRGGYDHMYNDVYMEADRFRALKASDSNPHLGSDGGRFSVGSNWSNGLAFGGWTGSGYNEGSFSDWINNGEIAEGFYLNTGDSFKKYDMSSVLKYEVTTAWYSDKNLNNFMGNTTHIEFGLDIAQNGGDPSSVRQKIVDLALLTVGSTKWNYDVERGDYPAGTNKCNLYCSEVISAAGASPGLPNGNPIKRALGGSGYPPVAGQWADPSYNIPGWEVLGPGVKPGSGDIAAWAHDYSDATGHMAIVMGAGYTIGTSGTNNSISITTYGFDQRYQPIVYRRFVGGK